jgi:hypothetical protein
MRSAFVTPNTMLPVTFANHTDICVDWITHR